MDLSLSMSLQRTTNTVLIGWLHSDKVRGEKEREGEREREREGEREGEREREREREREERERQHDQA